MFGDFSHSNRHNDHVKTALLGNETAGLLDAFVTPKGLTVVPVPSLRSVCLSYAKMQSQGHRPNAIESWFAIVPPNLIGKLHFDCVPYVRCRLPKNLVTMATGVKQLYA